MAQTKAEKAAYKREWAARNREHLSAYKRQWMLKDPGRVRASKRRSYLKHREKVCAQARLYRARVRERRLNLARTYLGLPAPTRPCPELCEIGCGRKASHLDHDHKTGEFRGWLCNRCNLALGALGDDISALTRALRYLHGDHD